MSDEKKFDLSEEQGRKVISMDKGSLKRSVGVAALFSIGYGDVGSSIYYALGVTTFWALGASPIAIAIAGIFFIFTVLTYAELSSAIPESGGSQVFAKRAFGDMASFIAGWALLLDYILTAAISAFTIGPYLGYFFPVLKTLTGNLIFTSMIIMLLTTINIVGIKESTNLSLGLAVLDIVTQGSIIVFGAVLVLNFPKLLGQIHFGTLPTWGNFIYGISIAMVAYTGIEAVSQLSGETMDPGKKIPRAMLLTLATVLVMYMGVSLVALSAVSPEELGSKWIGDPIAGIAVNLPIFGKFLAPWIAVLGATILLIAANAGVIGASRLSYSMANNYQIPNFLGRVHSKFNTPFISLSVFSVIAIIVVLLSRKITVLADLYNFGAMLAFSMAHLSLIGLRIREPSLARPFKLRGNIRIGRSEIPITAVLGLLATSTVWLIVVISHSHGRKLGFLWMIVGIALYLSYRWKTKMPILETVEVEKITVPEFKKLTTKKILVPTLGGPFTENVQIASQIAKDNGAELIALYVIEVPAPLPLDTFLPDRLEKADMALHRAAAIAREYGVSAHTQLIQSREAGSTIVDLAIEKQCDLIVLGVGMKKSQASLGATVEHVLTHSPCRVWICKYSQ